MTKVTNTFAFIQKANTVHNNYYTYTKANFVNSKTKVMITCPKHGNFEQSPNNHLTGYGCNKCAIEKRNTLNTKPKEEYIEKARKIHSNKYDYSLVEYKNYKTPVTILCSTHGEFSMAFSNHIHKTNPQGCPYCGVEKRSNARKLTLQEFIKKAQSVHSTTYNYSKTEYENFHTAVDIVCDKHGMFSQTPAKHLSGNGCPSCADYGFNKDKPAILYYLKINNGEAYKVGITNRTVSERFSVVDLKKLEVLNTWQFSSGKEAYEVEQAILKMFSEHAYKNSPLLLSGNTELFSIDVFATVGITHNADLATVTDLITKAKEFL
jgi:rubrerythrin